MKTSKARNRNLAATSILLLFMLSATANAAHAETTTTTIASSSETTTQESQPQVNETTGTNNQVGENQTQGDNLNVIEPDEAEQNEIQDAEANGTIAGEVQVNDTSVSATLTDPRFSLVPTEGANGQLNIQVSGQNVAGPRSFLVTLSNSMDPTTHTLAVTLDGVHVSQASSIGQVLHPSTNTASYIVMKSSSGYRLLVSIPHFSSHLLTILPLAPGPYQGFFPVSGVALAGVVIALTALITITFTRRKRIYAL
ncbi:MAG TPA: hypothetical protein VGR56_05080 [Nitrososphaerales archaeon]|nr:hypothetical protein [Nitrososphaerales archaeon]